MGILILFRQYHYHVFKSKRLYVHMVSVIGTWHCAMLELLYSYEECHQHILFNILSQGEFDMSHTTQKMDRSYSVRLSIKVILQQCVGKVCQKVSSLTSLFILPFSLAKSLQKITAKIHSAKEYGITVTSTLCPAKFIAPRYQILVAGIYS